MLTHLHDFTESRDQGLSKPKRKDEFRTGHEQLRSKTLEEAAQALVLGHV